MTVLLRNRSYPHGNLYPVLDLFRVRYTLIADSRILTVRFDDIRCDSEGGALKCELYSEGDDFWNP